MATAHFTPALFRFLGDLAKNNNRDWFNINKARYEKVVRDPALQFVRDFEPHLHAISPRFVASDKKSGGSLFRIYRDVRFSKDKSPYKTYTGVQFRHERGKDAHCPGYYLHLQPRQVFIGVGIWRPDSPTLLSIRGALQADPKGWKRAAYGKRFSDRFELAGESLKRPPKGFSPDDPLIEDLKRKDFIAVKQLTQKELTSAGFLKAFAGHCKAATPFMSFLCEALDVEF